MRKAILNMSLSNKIVAMVFTMVMIPVFLISWFFFREMQHSIRQEVSSNYVHFVEQYAVNLNYKLEIYKNLLQTLSSNQNFQTIMQQQYQYDTKDLVYISNFFTSEMKNVIFSDYPEIYNIMFYAESPQFPRDGRHIANLEAMEEEHWYSDALSTLMLESLVFDYQTLGLKKRILSFTSPMKDLSDGTYNRTLALIKIDVDAALIFEESLVTNYSSDYQFAIRDGKNNILFASHEQFTAQLDNDTMQNRDAIEHLTSGEVLIRKPVEKLNGEVLFLFPDFEIEQKTKAVFSKVVTFVIAIIIFTFVMSYLMSLILMKRLRRFIRKMDSVKEGKLEITEYIEGRDEIAIIDSQFNTMVRRLNEVIQENYIQGLYKKRAELSVLQNQINPHFLFNTLESINSMASIMEAREISAVTESLGDMLRYSINISDSLVPLSNELNNIVHYVNIQNVRFDDRFLLSIQIAEHLQNVKVLKLILQPIVENAILHAFRGRRGVGRIEVTAEQQDGQLRLVISDNGIGMSSEVLQHLNNTLASSEHHSDSIGLHNVHSRVHLTFGQQYGVQIESVPGVGTKVAIVMPFAK